MQVNAELDHQKRIVLRFSSLLPRRLFFSVVFEIWYGGQVAWSIRPIVREQGQLR
jgi:hypothetical protein